MDVILDLPCSLNTKYFALQVLEILIKTRWKALPRDQCESKSSGVQTVSGKVFKVMILGGGGGGGEMAKVWDSKKSYINKKWKAGFV